MEDILEKIYKATLKFLVPLTPDQTYSTIVEEAVKLVGADYGSIALKEHDELHKVYSSLPLSEQSEVRSRGYAYKSLMQRMPIVVPIEDTGQAHPELLTRRIKSTVHIPLAYKNESMGVLILNSQKDQQFKQREVDILKLFGSMASLAIHKTLLYNETHQALESRDQFISMASHELRTPLTAVNGYIQLLATKIPCDDSSTARWFKNLTSESFRLTTLVKELLEVSRINAGQFRYTYQVCSLHEVIEKSLGDFALNFPDRKVMVDDVLAGSSDNVVGDESKLVRVFDNLLENAAKYSSVDSEILVKIRSLGSYLVISISDKGKGIKKNELSKIFESFYRGSNHQIEGIGLGLYLVKDIVEKHRGVIKVKSTEHKGTTVQVRLPKERYG